MSNTAITVLAQLPLFVVLATGMPPHSSKLSIGVERKMQGVMSNYQNRAAFMTSVAPCDERAYGGSLHQCRRTVRPDPCPTNLSLSLSSLTGAFMVCSNERYSLQLQVVWKWYKGQLEVAVNERQQAHQRPGSAQGVHRPRPIGGEEHQAGRGQVYVATWRIISQ